MKVTTTSKTSVTETKDADVSDLASGDTITVVGTKASDGSLTATTIREGATGFGAFGTPPAKGGNN